MDQTFRELRRSRGLTLEAVGVLAGRDAATISRLERGLVKPEPETIVRLARALGISANRMERMLDRPTESTGAGVTP